MTRGKTMRVVAACAAALFVSTTTAPAFAGTRSVVRSVLLPGLGQAHDGHYTKATIFASAAIISWVGLFGTQVEYARSVEKYENEKRTYLYYSDQLDAGGVVKQSDIDGTYDAMDQAYEDADHDEKWRNFFIGALVVTYTVNIIDIILSEPDTGEVEQPAVSLEWSGDGMRVVRTINF